MEESETKFEFEPSPYTRNVVGGRPENFTAVAIKGVRINAKCEDGREEVVVSEEKPEFYSVYAHHVDGRWIVLDDYVMQENAIAYGRALAAHYNWAFEYKFPA